MGRPGDCEREARDGGSELQTQGKTHRGNRGTLRAAWRDPGCSPHSPSPRQVPKASLSARCNSVTWTQPQRWPRPQGNPGKPLAGGAPPRGGEMTGGGDPGEARLPPSPFSSSLPSSPVPQPAWPVPHPSTPPRMGGERGGDEGARPAPALGPGLGRSDACLCFFVSCSLRLSFPWPLMISTPPSPPLSPCALRSPGARQRGLGPGTSSGETRFAFLCAPAAAPHPPAAQFRPKAAKRPGEAEAGAEQTEGQRLAPAEGSARPGCAFSLPQRRKRRREREVRGQGHPARKWESGLEPAP